MTDAIPSTPARATVGRMVIDLLDNGTSRPTPLVTFEPVGRFTPGMMFEYVPLFANEIERAHACDRHRAAHGPPPSPLPSWTDTYDYGITAAPSSPRRRTR